MKCLFVLPLDLYPLEKEIDVQDEVKEMFVTAEIIKTCEWTS